MSQPQPKIIVLDDDPTGSQTVHSCLLLMQWDVETLKIGLQDEVPIFFILTNTRAIAPEAAREITQEVCLERSSFLLLYYSCLFVRFLLSSKLFLFTIAEKGF